MDTKQQAINAVQTLQRMGLSNIDVGCMQINLHYHPAAFKSLDNAFDPTINVTYAANYLKALRKDMSSWREAAGIYHSVDPEKAQYADHRIDPKGDHPTRQYASNPVKQVKRNIRQAGQAGTQIK